MIESVFLGMFLFGSLLTLVTTLSGAHHLHLPTHHVRLHLRLPGHGGAILASILSTATLLAFMTCFGAAGYAALHFAAWPLLMALGAAVPAGLVGGGAVAGMLEFLRRGETELLPEPLTGKLARVTIPIPEGRVGEVVLELASGIRNEAARAVDGAAIARGTEVVVIDAEGGVVLVQPLALGALAEGG